MQAQIVIETLRKELFEFQIKHKDVLSSPLKTALYNMQEDVMKNCNDLSPKEVIDLYHYKLRELSAVTKELAKRNNIKV